MRDVQSLRPLKLLTVAYLFMATSGTAWAQITCEGLVGSTEAVRLFENAKASKDPANAKGAPSSKEAAAAALNASLANLSPVVRAHLEGQLLSYASAILNVPLTEVQAARKVPPLAVRDLGETGTVKQEAQGLKQLAALSDSGQLEGLVLKLLSTLKAKADQVPQLLALRQMPPEKEQFVVHTLISNVEGLLALRGLTKNAQHIQYTEWPALSATMKARLDASPRGLENILHFANAKESSVTNLKILVNGPESFAVRDALMTKAKKSIDILSWAIYADKTGFEAADLLIQKHREGVKVRVMIDGQVSVKPGYNEAVQKLEKAGIEVIRWTSTTHPFEGQHRKMIIIDGEHVIAGGLNFGDVYSHKNPDPKVSRWRDTDFYFQGEAVAESLKLFAKLWNEQVTSRGLSFQQMKPVVAKAKATGTEPETLTLLDHDPAKVQHGSTIIMTLLKGIREAQRSVDIENAYVVLFPELKAEIQAAIARGVRVRVLTNSATSVDEPIVSIPILRSAHALAAMGAEVYLRVGSTLHSKLAIIDGMYTFGMSYNLHPRSERIEGEMSTLVKSARFGANMTAVFNQDIQSSNAVQIQAPNQIQFPESQTFVPALRMFYDML